MDRNILSRTLPELAFLPEAKSLGLNVVLDAIRVVSGFGKQQLRLHRAFAPSDESLARRHFDTLSAVMDAMAANRKAYSALVALLSSLPSPDSAIGNLPNIDFLELARLYYLMRDTVAIAGLLDDMQLGSKLGLSEISKEISPVLEFVEGLRLPGKDGFALRDSASERLNDLRMEIRRVRTELSNLAANERNRLRHAAGLDSLDGPILAIRGSELEERLRSIAGFRIVSEERTSVMFDIEPTKQEQNLSAMLDELLAQEREEQNEICANAGKRISEIAETLERACAELGYIDFLFALAALPQNLDAQFCIPSISDASIAKIESAVYLPLAIKEDFVPLDMEFSAGVSAVLGANMSGKTVAIKTFGECAALAAFGIPVPATSAELPLFSALAFFEAGLRGESSGLSAFGEEIVFFNTTLEFPSGSLIIIDEPLHTTAAAEGEALLSAIANRFQQRANESVFVLLSTHYDIRIPEDRIFYMAGIKPEQLDTMRADELPLSAERIRQMTDYRLTRTKSTSQALLVAKLLGLPASLIDRARSLLDSNE